MAVLNGTDLMMYIDVEGAKTAVSHSTSHSLSTGMDLREISSKDSGTWKESAPGRQNWSVSTDGLVAWDDAVNYDKLLELKIARTKVTLRLGIRGDANIAIPTKNYYEGDAYITSVELSGGNEENATYSVSFEGTGALTMH